MHLHLNKLCVDYHKLQKGSHIQVFQNETSKRMWDSPDPAKRHVLGLYSGRTILCVNRGKKRETHPLERFSPVCGLMFHSSLDRGPIHSHVFFKTELQTFHFISSFLFFFFFLCECAKTTESSSHASSSEAEWLFWSQEPIWTDT